MKFALVDRLILPSAMAVALLLSLAYWWLDNVPHEVFGTVLFGLVIRHLIVNRAWFRSLARGRYYSRRLFMLVLHLILIANIIVLLATSLVISKALFVALPLPMVPWLRELHWFSAYWMIVIVGVHLGMHWNRVMSLVGSTLGLSLNRGRTLALRTIAGVLAVFGAWSFAVLGVWSKLTFTYSLEFWDFTSSVAPFFAHWSGVLGLFGVLTHYAVLSVKRSSSNPQTPVKSPVSGTR